MPTYYRPAPIVVARLLGLTLVGLAVVIFIVTLVTASLGGGLGWILAFLVVGLVATFAFGVWLARAAYVVRCDATGFRIRWVRGAGVTSAAWSEVTDATADTVRGLQLLVLHLSEGRSTSIPVAVLAIDKEEFVRAMQRHLSEGQSAHPLAG